MKRIREEFQRPRKMLEESKKLREKTRWQQPDKKRIRKDKRQKE